jgi:hypothetical protein
MTQSRKVKAAYFSKWRAIYYFIFFILGLALISSSIIEKGFFPKKTFIEYILTLGIFIACYLVFSWFPHMYRIISVKNPHIRTEGDKVIAFGKVFPKGPNDYILFERCSGIKLGLWTTLRNEDEEMHIPFMFKYQVEDYKE